jgi:hypothetical protein
MRRQHRGTPIGIRALRGVASDSTLSREAPWAGE